MGEKNRFLKFRYKSIAQPIDYYLIRSKTKRKTVFLTEIPMFFYWDERRNLNPTSLDFSTPARAGLSK